MKNAAGPRQDLLARWIPVDDVPSAVLPVPTWFLMRRHRWQPRPQAASLLSSGKASDLRLRLALWSMAEGWALATRGRPATSSTPRVDFARAVYGDELDDLEQRKLASRRVARAFTALRDVHLIAADEWGVEWIMKPGRGPHEREPWSTTLRSEVGRDVSDLVVPVPIQWFWDGWIDSLSGAALVVLLTLRSTEPQATEEGWFRMPRIRSQRLTLDSRTWSRGLEELRQFRLVQVATVHGSERGAVAGAHRAYRFRKRLLESGPRRPRVALPPFDAAVDSSQVNAGWVTRQRAPGWRPVLYCSPALYEVLHPRFTYLKEVAYHFDVRRSLDRHTTVRLDPMRLADPRERPRLLRALWDALSTLDQPFNVVEQALPEPKITQTDLQPGSPQHRKYVDRLQALTLPSPVFSRPPNVEDKDGSPSR